MDEEKKIKKYSLQLKMKKKNRIELIPLITDTLDAIDKITSITYVKERIIALLPEEFLYYLVENFDKGDLIVTTKQGEYLKELPTIPREDRYMAYITRSNISQIILEGIIDSHQINGRKITQADYFMKLIGYNYNYSKLPAAELLNLHNGQYGKRVVVCALSEMGLIPNKKDYYPTEKDVGKIQDKLLKIYQNSRGYYYARSQIKLDNFIMDKGVIKGNTSSMLFYDILPFLKQLMVDPDATYYIDNSFLPQNMPAMFDPDTNIDQDFGEYLKAGQEADAIKQKHHRHALYQSKIKPAYLEKINEYITMGQEQEAKCLALVREGGANK